MNCIHNGLPSVLWHCWWLGVWKSIWHVKIEWWGVDVLICLEQGAVFLHMVQLMLLHPTTPSSLASFKSRLVVPFCYWLTQLVMEKKPLHTHTHTHTHPFNGPFSRTTWVSRYKKGKTNLDFTEVRDSEWQWHQLGHMQVCISLQTDNHASAPPL